MKLVTFVQTLVSYANMLTNKTTEAQSAINTKNYRLELECTGNGQTR